MLASFKTQSLAEAFSVYFYDILEGMAHYASHVLELWSRLLWRFGQKSLIILCWPIFGIENPPPPPRNQYFPI